MVEGGDVFREEVSDIQWWAVNDEMDDLATLRNARALNSELTEALPPYSVGDPAIQTEISDDLLNVQSRAEIDARDDFATLSDVRDIDNELNGPPPSYSFGDPAIIQTEISEQLSQIRSNAQNDEKDHLANLRDMTQVEQLTESGVPDPNDRQARIAAKTMEIQQRLQVERNAREANTASQADDIGLSLSRSFPDYPDS
jgi:uncharacterized small protein (DUF1192 family)